MSEGVTNAPIPGGMDTLAPDIPEWHETADEDLFILSVDRPYGERSEEESEREYEAWSRAVDAIEDQLAFVRKHGSSIEIREALRATTTKFAPFAYGITAHSLSANMIDAVPGHGVIITAAYAAAGVGFLESLQKTGHPEYAAAKFRPIDIANKAQVVTEVDHPTVEAEGIEQTVLRFIPPQPEKAYEQPSREFRRWQLRNFLHILDCGKCNEENRHDLIALPPEYVEVLSEDQQSQFEFGTTERFWPKDLSHVKITTKPEPIAVIPFEDFAYFDISDKQRDTEALFPHLVERFAALYPGSSVLQHLQRADTDGSSITLAQSGLRNMLRQQLQLEEDAVYFPVLDDHNIVDRDMYYPTVRISGTDQLRKLSIDSNGMLESAKDVAGVVGVEDLIDSTKILLEQPANRFQALELTYLLHEMVGTFRDYFIVSEAGNEEDDDKPLNYDEAGQALLKNMTPGKWNFNFYEPTTLGTQLKIAAKAGAVGLALTGVVLINHATDATAKIADFFEGLEREGGGNNSSDGRSSRPPLLLADALGADELKPGIDKPEHDVPIWKVTDNGLSVDGYYGDTVYEYQIDGVWVDHDQRNYGLVNSQPMMLPSFEEVGDIGHIHVNTVVAHDSNRDSVMMVPIKSGTEISALSVTSENGPTTFILERFDDNSVQLLIFANNTGPEQLTIDYALVESDQEQLRAQFIPAAYGVDDSGEYQEQSIDQSAWLADPLNETSELSTRQVGILMNERLKYLDHNPQLNDRLQAVTSPDEFLSIISEAAVCDCDVCASVTALIAAAKEEPITIASGYLNDQTHLGSEGSELYLSAGEAHGWNVDDRGEVFDFTPHELAQPLKEFESSGGDADEAQSDAWDDRLKRIEILVGTNFDDYVDQLERDRSFEIFSKGAVTAIALIGVAYGVVSAHSAAKRRREQYLNETNFHDPYKILETLAYSKTDGPISPPLTTVETDEDYIHKAAMNIPDEVLTGFIEDPSAHVTVNRAVLRDARELAKEALKKREQLLSPVDQR